MDEDLLQLGKRFLVYGDVVRGFGLFFGLWIVLLMGGVLGYQLGSRGKLDCGDESV